MDNSHFFGKIAEQIRKILVSDQKYGCLTRYLWIGFCIQPQGSLPQLKKFVAKKCCHLLSLQKEGTQSVLLFAGSPCMAALSAPKGRVGDKISQSYQQVVRCLNFRHHLSLVSQPDLTLPSNLTRSTLCGTGGIGQCSIFLLTFIQHVVESIS